MSLSIHLHSLHLDAQYGQTWHLLTQLRSGERTGRQLLWSATLLLPTLLSDSHVLISLVIHGLWWTFSGQVEAHVVLTCTSGVSPNHLPGQRQTMNHVIDTCPLTKFEGELNLLHEVDDDAVTHTHTHPFNGPFSGTTQVSRYQKGKTDLDFTEARDSEWQWNQLDHMQVCTSLQTDNHASTPPLCFLQAGCPSCCPTNSVKALKAQTQSYGWNLQRLQHSWNNNNNWIRKLQCEQLHWNTCVEN